MIKGRDFVFVGLQSWDISIGSNCKNIAMEVARHNRVLYVSKPLDRISLLKNRSDEKVQRRLAIRKGQEPKLEQITPSLWNLYPEAILESINWLHHKPAYNYLNRINNQRLSNQIRQTAEELGFRDIIVFNDNDFISYRYLKETLSPDLYLYYIRDNLTSQPYFKKRTDLEAQTIRKADAVVTNSAYLQQHAARFNPKAYFVGQGCDIESFLQTAHAKPADLQALKTPIVGYAGLLSDTRLDIDLIDYVAKKMPDVSFVLIGPQDASFQHSRLHQRENIYFLGAKKPDEVPAYLQHFDVCINPQIVNDMTIGNYPRKIDEYLAMGKPVVATKTLAMEYFQGHTYLCHHFQEYVDNIRLALQEDTALLQEQRRCYAREHTWTANVNNIYQVIESLSSVEYSASASGKFNQQT